MYNKLKIVTYLFRRVPTASYLTMSLLTYLHMCYFVLQCTYLPNRSIIVSVTRRQLDCENTCDMYYYVWNTLQGSKQIHVHCPRNYSPVLREGGGTRTVVRGKGEGEEGGQRETGTKKTPTREGADKSRRRA